MGISQHELKDSVRASVRSHSNAGTETDQVVHEIDHAAEKKVLRKLDLHIVPLVMVLYLLSFLDKVNIGNARLYGLEEDLGLSGNQYQIISSVLFVTYVTFEIPSNLVLKRIRPSRWIAFLTIAWGIIATCMGLTQNFAGMVTCRVLLGVFEAGLFPGLTIYLTLFYTRHELALRVGYLFVSAALAGACGGLLAYAIGHMDGVADLRGWRWILILEGLPTVITGIFCWLTMSDDPDHCTFLIPEERKVWIAKRNRQQGYSASGLELHQRDIWDALKDWKIWCMCFAHFGGDTMLYGYSTFLPTIIKSMGSWSAAEVQALTIPCYSVGAIVYLVVAWLSDRSQRRALYAVCGCLVSIIGYAVLAAKLSPGAHYVGTFLVGAGLYVVVGIPMSWLPTNCPRYGKKATASGLQMTIGNLGGIAAPFLYPTSDGPHYVRGQVTTLALVAYAAALYTFMALVYKAVNRSREEADHTATFEGKSEEEVAEMGDHNPSFRYHV